MNYWAGLPEFVRESRLDAQIYPGLTVHSVYDRQTGSSKQQSWYRDPTFRARRGGQGKVWLEQCFTGGPFHHSLYRAVKEIELERPIDRDDDRLRELEALAKFSRPRYREFIIESYGWYLGSDNLLCIAMEYCKLGDLAQYLESNGRLTENDTNIITTQVLASLNFMHDEDWAHRDLKLSNILIVRQPPERWGVKISDLGLSKRTQSHLYDSTTVKGTPGLLAPELAGFMGMHASRTADPKSIDMWCLGCTVYEMVTGRKPFADLSLFSTYCNERRTISEDSLVGQASPILVDFIQSLMWVEPRARLDVATARHHQWIKDTPLPTLPLSQNPISPAGESRTPLPDTSPRLSMQPESLSGSWSTGSGFHPTNFLPQRPTSENPFTPHTSSSQSYYSQHSSQYPLAPSPTHPYVNSPYYYNRTFGPYNEPFSRLRQYSAIETTPPAAVSPDSSSNVRLAFESLPTEDSSASSESQPEPVAPNSSSPTVELGCLPIADGSTFAKSEPKPIVTQTGAHGKPEPPQSPKQALFEITSKEVQAMPMPLPAVIKPASRGRKFVSVSSLIAFSKTFELPTPIPKDLINIVTNDPVKRAALVEESQQRRTSYATVTSNTKDTSASTNEASAHRDYTGGVAASQKHVALGDLETKKLIDTGGSSVEEQLGKDIDPFVVLEGPLRNSDWQTVENKKKKKKKQKRQWKRFEV
ncbi:kinase-like domain-containing protein [Xylaria sp. FL0064]|nr:kinase-like domain-containing protein [Xylaria sp. FL0064]